MCSRKILLTCSLLAAVLAVFSLLFILGNYPSSAATASSQSLLPYWKLTCMDCPPSFHPSGDRYLQLDKDGNPHLVYTGEGKLYHAWRSPGGWQSEVITSSMYGIGSAAIVFDPQGDLHIAYIFNFSSGGALFLYTRTPQIVLNLGVYNFLGLDASVSGLAVDSNGNAHIAYYDSAQFKLRYASQTGPGTWQQQIVDSGENVGLSASLSLDDQGYGHLSYSANKGGGGLRYAYQDATGWHLEEVDPVLVGLPTSLALDAGGRPHISYTRSGISELRHAYQDGTGWHTEMVAPAGLVSAPSSLAFDPQDAPEDGPCIAFGEIGPGVISEALKLACRRTGIWQIQTIWQVQTLDEHGGENPSLRYDHDGHYQIAHFSVESGELRWTREDSAPTSSEIVARSVTLGSPVAIELDNLDYAHILYNQTDPFDQVRYTYQDAAGWHSPPVTETLTTCEDMALDSQDNPHLSCIANNQLVYAHLDSGGWHTQTLASLGVPWGYSSIAVDNYDYTQISYANPNHGSLEYAFIGAGSPVTETVNAYGGAQLSLALSSSGQPYISYANPGGGLELAYRDNGGWHILNPLPSQAARTSAPDSPINSIKGTSLVLDSSDQPHIAYVDTDGTCGLHYLYAAANHWSDELVDANPNGCAGLFTSLKLDSAGYPHIAYYFEGEKDGDLRYAFEDAAGWHLQEVDTSGNVGISSSLALDPDGKAWIAYLDYTHGDVKLAYTFPGYAVHLPFISYRDFAVMLPCQDESGGCVP